MLRVEAGNDSLIGCDTQSPFCYRNSDLLQDAIRIAKVAYRRRSDWLLPAERRLAVKAVPRVTIKTNTISTLKSLLQLKGVVAKILCVL